MLQLGNLGNLANILSNSLISATPLWKRDVSTIKPFDIQAFLALHKHTERYSQAIREVNQITEAGSEALLAGEVIKADFAFYEHDRPVFTCGELIEWLSTASVARRCAILFALEMKMDPKTVIGLEWKNIRQYKFTPLAAELVNNMPRHFKLKYVFWDYLASGSAAPLFGLAESALEVSQGLGYDVLCGLYKDMVLIDSDAEVESFIRQFNLKLDTGIIK